jgi:putative heme-binding domain-containing protein
MEQELAGRTFEQVPVPLDAVISNLMADGRVPALHLRLALRLGHPDAVVQALQLVSNSGAAEAQRLQLIQTLGESKRELCVPAFIRLLETEQSPPVVSAVLQALSRYHHSEIAEAAIRLHSTWSASHQQQACDLLCARPTWSLAMLQAIDNGRLARSAVSHEQLRRIQRHDDPNIDALVEKHWGNVRSASAVEIQKRIDEVIAVVNSAVGISAAGKAVFTSHCAKCHQLFGEGTSVGPDLTGVERRNLDVLVANIVEPGGVVRPEYQNHQAVTTDGLVLIGLLAESTPETITLLDAENKRTSVSRQDLDELKPIGVSIMPERLLDDLSPQQIRDLIAYLRSDQPK